MVAVRTAFKCCHSAGDIQWGSLAMLPAKAVRYAGLGMGAGEPFEYGDGARGGAFVVAENTQRLGSWNSSNAKRSFIGEHFERVSAWRPRPCFADAAIQVSRE